MRYWLILLAFLCISLQAHATTRYVAQSAGTFTGGTACNGQTAITPATWGATSESPGDITYICGTITAAAGANLFGFSWSGSSGNVIKLIFDTNAILQAPYFPQGTGAIDLNCHQYIVVDGGSNGIIQNTNNGNANGGYGFFQATTGIQQVCANDEIKNLHILNLFYKTDTATHAPNNPDGEAGIVVTSGSNILIHDNVFSGMAAGVVATSIGTGDTNNQYYNNEFTVLNLGIEIAGGNVASGSFYFYNNKYHDVQAWDDTSGMNLYHHNFIHFYDCSSGGGPSAAYVYNNYSYGNYGNTSTASFFFEGDGCLWSASGVAYFWNNVFTTANLIPGIGYIAPAGNTVSLNNTMIGPIPPNAANQCTGWSAATTVTKLQNNIAEGCGQIFSATATFITALDYNTYADSTSGNPLWQVSSASGSTLSAWQTSCTSVFGSGNGCDAHSSYSSSALTNINTTTGAISTGFVGIAAGTNLTSLCTGALVSLCSDTTLGNTRTAKTRPSTGAWDTGAYCFTNCGGGSVTLTPSPENFGAVQLGNSSLVSFTLTNNSSATVSAISPSVAGGNSGDFVVGNVGLGSCNAAGNTIAVGASCAVAVTFTPSVIGTRSTTLNVSYTGGDGASPQTSALTGQGTGQVCLKCFVRNDEKMEQRRGND